MRLLPRWRPGDAQGELRLRRQAGKGDGPHHDDHDQRAELEVHRHVAHRQRRESRLRDLPSRPLHAAGIRSFPSMSTRSTEPKARNYGGPAWIRMLSIRRVVPITAAIAN